MLSIFFHIFGCAFCMEQTKMSFDSDDNLNFANYGAAFQVQVIVVLTLCYLGDCFVTRLFIGILFVLFDLGQVFVSKMNGIMTYP
jgi:hypothetical protein